MAMEPGKGNEPGCDILVSGRYFCDLILTGLDEMPRLGYEVWGSRLDIQPGASYIPAVACRRLGLRVAWPCYFGNDLFSQFVKEQALREGLNEDGFLDIDRPALGVTFSFSFASERAFASYQDQTPKLPYPELIRRLRPAWVLLVQLWQGQELAEVSAAARQSNTRIFMDCQAHQTSLDNPQVRSALQQVDVFSPNLEEALQLARSNNLETALSDLAALTPLVVIKLGREGAIARQGSQIARVPGIQAQVVDTTGAGDNFDCGFLYGRIQGYSLEDSLRCGNICGGLSTQACGGTASAPTAVELEKWLATYQARDYRRVDEKGSAEG